MFKLRYVILLTVLLVALLPPGKTTAPTRSTSNRADQALRSCTFVDPRHRPGALHREMVRAVSEAAAEYDIPEDLLYSMIAVESQCRADARSHRGAVGLMQLMPKTAEWLGVKNPRAVRENVMGGAKYISYLLQRFDGNRELALAAYNAGPARVSVRAGVPAIKETRHYLIKVMQIYEHLSAAEKAPEAVTL